MNKVSWLKGKTDRQQFIIKVYALVFVNLLFTTLCCAAAMWIPAVQDFMKKHWYLHWIALIVGVTLSCFLSCSCFKMCTACQRKVPYNYILYFIFGAAYSYMVAGFCSYYDPVPVLCAGATTMAMTFGLTVVAFVMKDD